MSYRIAGVDVHKKMLAVLVSDVEVDGEHQFERRMFGSNPEQLRSLAAWYLQPAQITIPLPPIPKPPLPEPNIPKPKSLPNRNRRDSALHRRCLALT